MTGRGRGRRGRGTIHERESVSAPRRRLGRGLDALLGSPARGAAVADAVAAPGDGHATTELPVGALQPGRYQPRQQLTEDGLGELAQSIREQGVLQPLVVRPVADTGADGVSHEIVAGERRWRAAQMAGLADVPVVVRELDDQSALAVALIENLQREDLNPVDQARSLARLAEEFGLTHQQVADAVGRSRSAVTNLLRLLDLDDSVKGMLAAGELDMGHARALLPLDASQQLRVAQRAADGGWSVRQVEKAVRQRLDTQSRKNRPVVDVQTRWLQEQIIRELNGRVMLKYRADGSYKLDIGFGNLGELSEALDQVRGLVSQLRDTAGPRLRDAAK